MEKKRDNVIPFKSKAQLEKERLEAEEKLRIEHKKAEEAFIEFLEEQFKDVEITKYDDEN